MRMGKCILKMMLVVCLVAGMVSPAAAFLDNKFEKEVEKPLKETPNMELSENFKQAYANLSTENSVFLKIGDSVPSASFFEKITEEI